MMGIRIHTSYPTTKDKINTFTGMTTTMTTADGVVAICGAPTNGNTAPTARLKITKGFIKMDQSITVYEVHIGTPEGGQLKNKVIAGHVTQREGENYYLLRLMMVPNVYYFLAKNMNSNTKYTLYTKCIRNGDQVRFQNPVGFGDLQENLVTHLEIKLSLFDRSIFMSLYPKTKGI